MSNAKAAALVGALIFCGLFVLTSVAVAARDPYFAKLQGAFTRGCAEQATLAPVDAQDLFFDACSLIVHALKRLSPSNISADRFAAAFLAEIATAFEDLAEDVFVGATPPQDPCEQCVTVVQELETLLAATDTVPSIEAALVAGCEKRFSDLNQADQCRQLVGQLPSFVDLVLSNFPPLIACREINFCAAP
jgi:hypothetical protein